MEKKLDLSRSVYDLVTEYPELADILYNLGLKDIKNPNMFHSVAKLMTIPKSSFINLYSERSIKSGLLRMSSNATLIGLFFSISFPL